MRSLQRRIPEALNLRLSAVPVPSPNRSPEGPAPCWLRLARRCSQPAGVAGFSIPSPRSARVPRGCDLPPKVRGAPGRRGRPPRELRARACPLCLPRQCPARCPARRKCSRGSDRSQSAAPGSPGLKQLKPRVFSPATAMDPRDQSPGRASGVRQPLRTLRSWGPQLAGASESARPLRPHLVNLAEGAVSQLAHYLPHFVGVHIPADVLVFAGFPLLEVRQSQDAAEISESHG